MDAGENCSKKNTADPKPSTSEPSSTKSDRIERSVEDLFRNFEGKSELGSSRTEIIADFANIKIEIAEKDSGESESPKDMPEKTRTEKYRLMYAAGAVVAAAAVAIIFMLFF